MRILMLAQFYPPIIGGEENHVRNLSRGLAERGHHVAVVTTLTGDLPRFAYEDGVSVYRIRTTMQRLPGLYSDEGRTHAPPLPDPETVQTLRRILDAEEPDIIHAHNWFVHSYLPLKHTDSVPLIMTLHDYSMVCIRKNMLHRGAICTGPAPVKCLSCASEQYGIKTGAILAANTAMRSLEVRRVDHFLPVSQAVATGNQLERLGVSYAVVPNFIPDNLMADASVDHPALSQLPEGDFLLYVGDLSAQKGVDILLQAHSRAPDAPPLVLAGRANPDLLATVDTSRVIYLGPLPHQVVLHLWQRCRFGIVPSIWADPCPTVAMEAMAAGRPVIASAVGGLTDIVADGETGVLVTPGDPDLLAEAIRSLHADPARQEAMGNAALLRVRQFQGSTVIPRIEAAYLEQLQSAHTLAHATRHEVLSPENV